MSSTTRYVKKHVKAKQRRRLKAQERLARDRRQALLRFEMAMLSGFGLFFGVSFRWGHAALLVAV